MSESWGNHVALVVEGILKTPNDLAPIIPGLLLYRSLVKTHRVSLIIDSAAKEKVQYWLMVNGFTDHTTEIYWDIDDPVEVTKRRLAQVSRLRTSGSLSLVVESDMEVAKVLLQSGVPTFLLLHPQYIHPDFRPDAKTEITPWDELLAEQKRQREARATDSRLKDF